MRFIALASTVERCRMSKPDPLQDLSLKRLRQALSYEADTGVLRWLIAPGQRNDLIGTEAGGLGLDGYRKIRLNSILFQAHRLAWFHHFGKRPTFVIDHINGDRLDNRIANLRDVEHATNLENMRKAHVDSKSGALGVRQVGDVFIASICVRGKILHIGSFETVGEASAAYVTVKRRVHRGCTI